MMTLRDVDEHASGQDKSWNMSDETVLCPRPAEPLGGEDDPDACPESAGHLSLVRGGQERAGELTRLTGRPEGKRFKLTSCFQLTSNLLIDANFWTFKFPPKNANFSINDLPPSSRWR